MIVYVNIMFERQVQSAYTQMAAVIWVKKRYKRNERMQKEYQWINLHIV